MEFEITKVIAIVIILAAVVLDWPRAVAGLIAGYFLRRSEYPRVVIPLGVVGIAALGEAIYPLIGRTTGASWWSFGIGLISAGATAYGLFRTFSKVHDSA
jgi:hypothetical protein